MTASAASTPAQAAARFGEFTVIDDRTAGDHATGHLPGTHNPPGPPGEGHRRPEEGRLARPAPLRLRLRSPLRQGLRPAGRPGHRRRHPRRRHHRLDRRGHETERPAGARATWSMHRQVRLAGFLRGLAWKPAHWLSGAIDARARQPDQNPPGVDVLRQGAR